MNGLFKEDKDKFKQLFFFFSKKWLYECVKKQKKLSIIFMTVIKKILSQGRDYGFLFHVCRRISSSSNSLLIRNRSKITTCNKSSNLRFKSKWSQKNATSTGTIRMFFSCHGVFREHPISSNRIDCWIFLVVIGSLEIKTKTIGLSFSHTAQQNCFRTFNVDIFFWINQI